MAVRRTPAMQVCIGLQVCATRATIAPAPFPQQVYRTRPLTTLWPAPRYKDDTAQQAGEEMIQAFISARFSQVRLEIKPMKPVSAVCALGLNE